MGTHPEVVYAWYRPLHLQSTRWPCNTTIWVVCKLRLALMAMSLECTQCTCLIRARVTCSCPSSSTRMPKFFQTRAQPWCGKLHESMFSCSCVCRVLWACDRRVLLCSGAPPFGFCRPSVVPGCRRQRRLYNYAVCTPCVFVNRVASRYILCFTR